MIENRPLEDWEYPEPDDDDDDIAETLDCPACGAAIYEDAEQCPDCGEYVEFVGHGLSGRPVWFVALGLLGIIVLSLLLLMP